MIGRILLFLLGVVLLVAGVGLAVAGNAPYLGPFLMLLGAYVGYRGFRAPRRA